MKKILVILIAFIAPSIMAFAQDDLLADLQKEDSSKVKQDITYATFKGTRIINMHSIEMTGVGNLQFMIIHHFGEIWNKTEEGNNIARLFGLNGNVARTYMSFDYTPKYWLNLGVGFAGQSNVEGFAKFKIMRQQTGIKNYPVSIALLSNASFNLANKASNPAPNDFFWNKFSYLHQLLIARKMSENFSLQLMPSVIHNNITGYGYANTHDIFSLGIGGRYKIAAKKALTFEYVRQFNNWDNVVDKTGEIVTYSPNLISFGYDWDTGGHIFQFFVSNSSYASNIAQMSVNTKKDGFGQWCLGFNLNRSYSVKHNVKVQK